MKYKTPSDIPHSHVFFSGDFMGHILAHAIARNIVKMQIIMSSGKWAQFTFEDYKENIGKDAGDKIYNILHCLVKTGTITLGGNEVTIYGGYLTKHLDYFTLTKKFFEALENSELN